MLPRVFDLFVQEGQSLDRSQGGLGLGLAIVKSLVRLHGGTVTASSEGPGRGSCFTARLPLVAAQPPLSPSVSVVRPPTHQPASGRRVLIVDDNRDAAELLSEFVALRGYQVVVAYDGPSALQMVEEFVPHLALLDIGLPVMSGYELARRLKERSALRDTKLVAVTGYGQETDRSQSSVAGFDDHLVKPLDLAALSDLLDRLTAGT
jgi:CheY-like chemotaxis protein